MQIKGIIFDMDGTLLNTIGDIADAMNRALNKLGLTGHTIEQYKTYVGAGIYTLTSRVLPPEYQNESDIADFVESFRAFYSKNWHDKTHPYEGIMELLKTLRQKNISLGILSNKPHRFTTAIAEHFFEYNGHNLFSPIYGERSDFPVKPSPDVALQIAKMWNINPEQIAIIGDSDVDMQTAVNAGMYAIGVGWGFRSIEELNENGATLILHHPKDLIENMDKNNWG